MTGYARLERNPEAPCDAFIIAPAEVCEAARAVYCNLHDDDSASVTAILGEGHGHITIDLSPTAVRALRAALAGGRAILFPQAPRV